MNSAEHKCAAFVRLDRLLCAVSGTVRMLVCVLAVFVAGLNPVRVLAEDSANPAVASEKSFPDSMASREEVNRWISDLSNDAFIVRQAAASRLLSAGMTAREPLLAVVDGPDPETRAAARRLVALIDKTEFFRRLEAFASDTEGRQNLTLPGWDQYQKLVGSDAAARALFVDMQRQEGALLSAVFGVSRRAPGELLEARLLRLIQWTNTANDRAGSPPLGSCATMFFLGTVAEIDVSDNATSLIEILLQRPPMLETLRPEKRQEAARRLIVGWVLHCPTRNEDFLRRRLSIIQNAGLDEALPLALAVVGGEAPHKRVLAYTRALAVQIVGQLGRPEHVDRLEPLLDDVTNCLPPGTQMAGPPGVTVQVRDVALIIMLQLTGQSPADYGYVNARPQPPKTFQLQTLYRENNQQRDEAIAKWRRWRAEHRSLAEPAAKSN